MLELGNEEYSTLTFLNRSIFLDLQQLDSYKTDAKWMERGCSLAGGGRRVWMSLASGMMSDAASRLPLDGYDLIFIDDSTNAADRSATIRQVATRCPNGTLVVIHNYEVPDYRKAA